MSRMARRFDLVGVGDPVIDLVVQASRLPSWGDKSLGRCVGWHGGGTEANAACAASRLGMATAVCGVVGDDPHGRYLLADLARFGVALDLIDVRSGIPSASTLIFLSPGGERAVVYLPVTPAAAPRGNLRTMLESTRSVYTMPYDASAFCALAQAAHKAGTDVVVDVEAETLRDPHMIASVLRLADVLFFNEEGFVAATGTAPTLPALREALARSRAHTTVVTLGARGAIAADRQSAASQPAFSGPVADTTGAGDTFNAAFLVARGAGRDLPHSLAYACAAASLSIRTVGARTGLPTGAEIDQLLSACT